MPNLFFGVVKLKFDRIKAETLNVVFDLGAQMWAIATITFIFKTHFACVFFTLKSYHLQVDTQVDDV